MEGADPFTWSSPTHLLLQFFLERQLGVRQIRLNLSSAHCLDDLSDSLISLNLSVLICEMGTKVPT